MGAGPAVPGVREGCPKRRRNCESVEVFGAGCERGSGEKGPGCERASGFSVQDVRERPGVPWCGVGCGMGG